ncbi:acetolactate synthase large subunit [Halomonas llamarensis]|uniref:Acetolactate synthase large subunit n=1 Tax=Halomonas llamarensis TaxID=2945104 RepID=A0ABT0SSB8_9GAMM|nr:acetolactate synthase large subunit [Halomonas llamarensis]MCL7930641.1 acetolactate synthase large subunit [Halomonas llamarensis]
MKASELFVQALESEGVAYIFGVPGEENLDFLNALRGSSIRLILTRHEQGAGFMAATYGRLTGRVGVCLATLGPGATNLVTAAAYAQLGAMPMLMITGQKPIKTNKQGEFQIIDVVDMMTPLTKYTRQISSAHNIPARVREAFRRAQLERPGATHLELPEDTAREDTDAQVIRKSDFDIPQATEHAIDRALAMIQSARRPLLLLGAGANRHHSCIALEQLVKKTGMPFFSTQMGKGVVDERHPLFLGTAALSSDDFLHRAIEAADLIINVGHDVVEKPPFIMGNEAPEEGPLEAVAQARDAQVIHVNYVTAAVDAVYYPQQGVIGDIANSVERLTQRLEPQPHWDFSWFMQVKDRLDQQLLAGAEDDRFPIYPQRLVHSLRQLMPDDGIVALDNGVYKIWFARNYRAYQPNTVLLDNALASMGAGLPSAMAAKMVCPERNVVAVCGDGGFMMNSQELETAVRLKLDLTVLVLRDNGYGMIKWKQSNLGFEDFGLDFGNPDFVRYAGSYGAQGHRPESADDFERILQHCLAEPGVHLIDVPVDYSENEQILHQDIKAQSRAMVDSKKKETGT